jgi:aspartate kinase
MARIVMKFGGTSMAGIERIRNVARRVQREAKAGSEVLVVVSAMAGETDRLVQLCREAAALHDPTEYDVVVASGEQVTAGLLAMTLQNMGVQARSFMGWQLVRASGVHGNARVDAVESAMLDEALNGGTVAVIPGFQGVSSDGRLATLGRGGSDTSAVAIAAGLKADRCDIYTDVDGVYTTDPRIGSAPRCFRHARSGLQCARICRCAFSRPSRTSRVRASSRSFQERTWKETRSPGSPPTRMRRG